MKTKLIKNYNESIFTSAELSIIDYINDKPKDFINCLNIKDFCIDKPFSETTLQRLAKKLSFDSANEMKQYYTNSYINELNEIIKFMGDFEKDKNESKSLNQDKLTFKSYYEALVSNYSTIDWKTVDNLAKQIGKRKCIYVYQPDQIFAFNSFDFFSHFLNIKVYRIESLYRLKLLKDSKIEKNSILIFTKAFSPINEFEKEVLDLFKENEIDVYTISGVEGIFPSYIQNNIVIGNYKNTFDEYANILSFKIYYDPLVNIIIYNVFSNIFKK